MRRILSRIKQTVRKSIFYIGFVKDFLSFRRTAPHIPGRYPLWKDRKPQLFDKTATTGFDRHYIFHPAWAARILAKTKPEKHVDIASTLTFSTLVSAFLPVEFYDIRPAHLGLSNLESKTGDLMALPFTDGSIMSLSCMHTIEHIGLGRYGDPIDSEGDIKAMKELKRVTARKGSLLFVTPIGKPRLVFNAHRIYSYDEIVRNFEGFELKEFSLIPDKATEGDLIQNASKELADKQSYACGCFWFVKK